MKNRIIAGTGNSNLVKMDLSNINSFAEFKAAAEAGTLLADVIATDDGTGTTQIGTPLTVANLLTDATAASLGVTSTDPTIEEAFSSLVVTQAAIDAFAALGVTLTGGAIDAIKALAEFERGLISIETFSGNRSINANSSGTFRASDLSVEWPSGYRPIAFAAINFSTSAYIRLRSYTVDATGTNGLIGVWNYGSNNIDCNCTVKMIFVKESVL